MGVSRKHDDPVPSVSSLQEAERWIRILHRRTVSDSKRLMELEARVRRLEENDSLWKKLLTFFK